MTDEQLREWAYRTGDGDVGAAVLRLMEEKRQLQERHDKLVFAITETTPAEAEIVRLQAENAALRTQVAGHCERIAAQSALLSKAAEHVPLKHPIDESKTFDGTYPMRSTVADFRSKGSG